MATEREIMLAGGMYDPSDPELVRMRLDARRLTHLFNQTSPDEADKRAEMLGRLFGRIGPRFEVEPPFRCDYGCHIFALDGLYMNFGCVILDVCEVHIGRQVMFAPGVQVYTATHPLDPDERTSGRELGRPVHIGNRVWLGGGAMVLPGVTIGDDTVIGAGSVVTRDIPARAIAAGNPCRVLRMLD